MAVVVVTVVSLESVRDLCDLVMTVVFVGAAIDTAFNSSLDLNILTTTVAVSEVMSSLATPANTSYLCCEEYG